VTQSTPGPRLLMWRSSHSKRAGLNRRLIPEYEFWRRFPVSDSHQPRNKYLGLLESLSGTQKNARHLRRARLSASESVVSVITNNGRLSRASIFACNRLETDGFNLGYYQTPFWSCGYPQSCQVSLVDFCPPKVLTKRTFHPCEQVAREIWQVFSLHQPCARDRRCFFHAQP